MLSSSLYVIPIRIFYKISITSSWTVCEMGPRIRFQCVDANHDKALGSAALGRHVVSLVPVWTVLDPHIDLVRTANSFPTLAALEVAATPWHAISVVLTMWWPCRDQPERCRSWANIWGIRQIIQARFRSFLVSFTGNTHTLYLLWNYITGTWCDHKRWDIGDLRAHLSDWRSLYCC